MNTQPVEKIRHDLDTVEVHSIFYTIQGEGPFAGRPAVFVRLAGCNLQCPWCDTDYTSTRQVMSLLAVRGAILSAVGAEQMIQLPLVVITGGEPFRQAALGALVAYLAASGYTVQIETNGTIQPEATFPWIDCTVVCSPKTPVINPIVRERANCFKYVLNADAVDSYDGLPSDVLGRKHNSIARPPAYEFGDTFRVPVYLQPADVSSLPNDEPDDEKRLYARECADEANAAHLLATVQSCLTHGYILCLQMHKIANLP